MRKHKGSAQMDYILPTAIVGIVLGLAMFQMVSSGNFIKFIANSLNLDEKQIQTTTTQETTTSKPTTLAGGSFGGTPSNPIEACKDGECSIDYGSFVLSGIPENFQDFVEAQGSSGGTEKLVAMLYQIAEQLEEEGKNSEADEIKKLANLAHNMAAVEKLFEDKTKACGNNQICIQNFLDATASGVPEGFDDTLATTFFDETNKLLLQNVLNIGQLQFYRVFQPNLGVESSLYYHNKLEGKGNSLQFVETYDSIMANENIPAEMRGTVNELFWEIGTLAVEFDTILMGTGRGIDPITGNNTDFFDSTEGDAYNEITNYEGLSLGNVKASLLCSASWNIDTGSDCH
ncbi:MAG: hypothetical protein AB7V50_11080 [Vampirovibrionia bacterium]